MCRVLLGCGRLRLSTIYLSSVPLSNVCIFSIPHTLFYHLLTQNRYVGTSVLSNLPSICPVSIKFSKPCFLIKCPENSSYLFLSKSDFFIPLSLKIPHLSYVPDLISSINFCRSASLLRQYCPAYASIYENSYYIRVQDCFFVSNQIFLFWIILYKLVLRFIMDAFRSWSGCRRELLK